MIPNLLTIAGSDPGGGAGIQADLKTFAALGTYGMAVLTALTAQNTRGVIGVHVPPPDFVGLQIEAILADIEVHGVKIGMLASGDIVEIVARALAQPGMPRVVVLDPVLVATSGDSLGAPDVVAAMRRRLLPLASVVTPNLAEAARLTDRPVPRDEAGMRAVAERLHGMGARAVLVKGGHLEGGDARDLLFDGREHRVISAPRVETRNTHGTGCTLSAAIAAFMAHGRALPEAVADAKAYLSAALARSGALRVGGGHGPVHHFHDLWPRPGDSA